MPKTEFEITQEFDLKPEIDFKKVLTKVAGGALVLAGISLINPNDLVTLFNQIGISAIQSLDAISSIDIANIDINRHLLLAASGLSLPILVCSPILVYKLYDYITSTKAVSNVSTSNPYTLANPDLQPQSEY